ncbi:MAG: AmmeMemoRadiSam system protein B [Candidatus Sericytochromatia bacterium]|nr:AmmeMemoRadiSam system protein B [Candidatus Tanganyikabacteria bacterium]
MQGPSVPDPLRNLDLRPLPEDPERVLVIDRLGVQPEPLAVPLVFFLVAQHFDGRRTSAELAALLAKEGIRIDPGSVELIARQLADAQLLDDERVRARIAAMERDLLSGPRAATLAGSCFPVTADACGAWVERQMAQAGPPLTARADHLPALVVPHIDPRKGGVSYAKAYRELLAAPPADLYVILGIGHAGLRHGISLAPVDFETPFGLLPADRGLCTELVARTGDWLLADQLVQAQEHSIECQAVFLQHLLKHRFAVLPLLTGFGTEDTERMAGVFGTLRELLRESGKTWTVLSSVDFSHVGPLYGDAEPGAPLMGKVEEQDRLAISRLEAADDGGFWEAIHAHRNPTRICGYSSMWGMLQLVEPRRGRLVDYSHTVMDEADSRVTFAAMAFD